MGREAKVRGVKVTIAMIVGVRSRKEVEIRVCEKSVVPW
jgi:hypothetical protein